jgi:ribonuclease P protein component
VQKPGRNSFSKPERLRSKVIIDKLFAKSNSFSSYPIRFLFCSAELQTGFPAQTLFVVPKKKFRKAHDRNLLKRRMKEAYRINKQLLYEALSSKDQQLTIAVIYTSSKHEEFGVIESAVKAFFEKMKG